MTIYTVGPTAPITFHFFLEPSIAIWIAALAVLVLALLALAQEGKT